MTEFERYDAAVHDVAAALRRRRSREKGGDRLPGWCEASDALQLLLLRYERTIGASPVDLLCDAEAVLNG